MGSEKPAIGVVSRGGGLSSAKSRREGFWFCFVFKISMYFFALCFFFGLFVLGLFVVFAVTHVCVAIVNGKLDGKCGLPRQCFSRTDLNILCLREAIFTVLRCYGSSLRNLIISVHSRIQGIALSTVSFRTSVVLSV